MYLLSTPSVPRLFKNSWSRTPVEGLKHPGADGTPEK